MPEKKAAKKATKTANPAAKKADGEAAGSSRFVPALFSEVNDWTPYLLPWSKSHLAFIFRMRYLRSNS